MCICVHVSICHRRTFVIRLDIVLSFISLLFIYCFGTLFYRRELRSQFFGSASLLRLSFNLSFRVKVTSSVNIFVRLHAFYAILCVSLVVLDISDIFSAVVNQLVLGVLGPLTVCNVSLLLQLRKLLCGYILFVTPCLCTFSPSCELLLLMSYDGIMLGRWQFSFCCVYVIWFRHISTSLVIVAGVKMCTSVS